VHFAVLCVTQKQIPWLNTMYTRVKITYARKYDQEKEKEHRQRQKKKGWEKKN
jgi:hypothetical protein